MECCAPELLQGTWFRRSVWGAMDGRRMLELTLEDEGGEHAIEWRVVELGDGRVMMIATESPVGYEAAWRPWFQTFLTSLEIWLPGRDGEPEGSEWSAPGGSPGGR
jgi:hypothetical protein